MIRCNVEPRPQTHLSSSDNTIIVNWPHPGPNVQVTSAVCYRMDAKAQVKTVTYQGVGVVGLRVTMRRSKAIPKQSISIHSINCSGFIQRRVGLMMPSTYHPITAIAVGKGDLESLRETDDGSERGDCGSDLHFKYQSKDRLIARLVTVGDGCRVMDEGNKGRTRAEGCVGGG